MVSAISLRYVPSTWPRIESGCCPPSSRVFLSHSSSYTHTRLRGQFFNLVHSYFHLLKVVLHLSLGTHSSRSDRLSSTRQVLHRSFFAMHRRWSTRIITTTTRTQNERKKQPKLTLNLNLQPAIFRRSSRDLAQHFFGCRCHLSRSLHPTYPRFDLRDRDLPTEAVHSDLLRRAINGETTGSSRSTTLRTLLLFPIHS